MPSPSAVLAQTPGGPQLVRWKSLILATGARELFLPFPGWTLPGVFGAGGIQALVKQGMPVAGKRIIVAGTGPLLLAAADFLRSKGASVPLIIEQAPSARIRHFVASLARSPAKLVAGISLRAHLLGTRYSTDSYPLEVLRFEPGLRVTYRSGQRAESIECDYFACGFNLIPNVELPTLLGCDLTSDGFVCVDHHLRTTVKNIHAVGEVTGIGGVDKAIIQGRIAAHAAHGDNAAADRLAAEHEATLAFTRRLSEAFALRPELLQLARPSTILCRCEDVRLSCLEGSISGRDAKLQTRCGMGPCQGRVCGPILQRMLGSEAPQVRPPLFPTPVSTLAAAHGKSISHTLVAEKGCSDP